MISHCRQSEVQPCCNELGFAGINHPNKPFQRIECCMVPVQATFTCSNSLPHFSIDDPAVLLACVELGNLALDASGLGGSAEGGREELWSFCGRMAQPYFKLADMCLRLLNVRLHGHKQLLG